MKRTEKTLPALTFIEIHGKLLRALIGLLCASIAVQAQIAVRGETVYTMVGAPIRDGVVLIRDGKIERVGPASQVAIPSGYKVLTARVVTPGLIDARSTVGLSGYLNQPHDQMQLDTSAPIQPELRAIDAYDAREFLVGYLRSFGITTVHTGHGPGALISGQTMIVKTTGETIDQAVIVPEAMIAASLGQAGLGQSGKSPGTRSKQIAMLRAELLKAQDYVAKQKAAGNDPTKAPARDIRMEALARVIRGEIPLLVNVHRAHDIVSALRVAKEFGIKIVLDGAAESYLVMDQIKAAGVPVIIHPTMYRAAGDAENLSMETAAKLRRAGIPVAMQSGYESYVPKTRVVLFEAAIAAANGLSFEEALATVTIDAARILGIANRVGSLEPGKDADLALFDGDPFEYTSHVTGVIVNGQVVSEEKR
ncbi:MAG: amidohydrolase [Pyrinomonas sp.]|mgnify:CR=1 FL=1|uniref:amidohydrolase family protein n=1 Tax=Pyrinomonas sp. TaxID=2080306 RepID=UPI0033201F8E